MHNHSYENEFNLHVNEISYEKMGTKTRFEEEAKGNSDMAYFSGVVWTFSERKRPFSNFSGRSVDWTVNYDSIS